MKHPRSRRAELRRRSPYVLRRAGTSLALAVFVALVPVVAHDAGAATKSAPKTALSTTQRPARLPDVTHNAGSSSLLLTSRPIKQRHAGLDDLTLVAIVLAVFGGFHRRADLHSGERFRFDATFAHRRGPPLLSIAR